MKYAPAPVFAALALVMFAAAGREAPGSGFAVGYLDRPMPAFSQPAMAGTPAGLAREDLLGQVSLVNVFASWCASCRAEHPMLMELAARSDVPIYGINWKDGKGAGKLFLDRFGNPYHATGADNDGALGAQLNVTGVPETYVVDAEGNIRYRHLGPITEEIWQKVLFPLVEKLRAAS